ncbi:MAG: hypothetical protein JWN40_1120 [Phycisphaerales bacterium]|nr:hypothetical protein [Phycisphaerales bacterium]
MVQLTTIIITASVTFILGILSFVLSQVLQRLYIEAAQELRKTIGRVAHALIFHANAIPQTEMIGGAVCGLPRETLQKVSNDLRCLASDLRAAYNVIPTYRRVGRWFKLPSRGNLFRASAELVGWSNALFYSGYAAHHDFRKEIANALGIEIDANVTIPTAKEGA